MNLHRTHIMRRSVRDNRRRLAATLLCLLAVGPGCAGDMDAIAPPRLPPPQDVTPVVTGVWRALELRGAALPATAERFENDGNVSGVTEFRLDAAQLELDADGRYSRTVVYSEWLMPDSTRSGSWHLRHRYRSADFGTWTRADSVLTLTSGWIQNLVVRGRVSANGHLRLQHGLTPGDSLLDIGFARF
jgi:hypothetical protein